MQRREDDEPDTSAQLAPEETGALLRPLPVFGLGKADATPVPLSAFDPVSDEEAAEWGL